MHASTSDVDFPLLVPTSRPGTLGLETSEPSTRDSELQAQVSIDHKYNDSVADYFLHTSTYLSHVWKLLHHVRPYEGVVFVPLSILEMLLIKYIGEISGSIYKALVDLNSETMQSTLVNAMSLYCAYIVLATCSEWLCGILAVVWRSRLSEALHEAYFRRQSLGIVCSKLDNCDQRMTSEISGICSQLPNIVQKISASPLKLVFYGFLTSRYTGALAVAAILIFFFGSIFLQKIVNMPLARELVSLEQCEGDFRSGHIRLRDASIDIALQSDNIAEKHQIDTLFQNVLKTQRSVVFKRALVVGITKCIDYCGAMLNYILISVAIFFGRHDDGDAGGDRAQFISNASFFTLTFIFTLTELVDLSQNISEVLSLLCRVYGLSDMLDDTKDQIGQFWEENEIESSNNHESASMFEVQMPPTLFNLKQFAITMEISIIEAQGRLLDDVKAVFPSAPLLHKDTITCCMTLQPRDNLDFESMDKSLNDYLKWERRMAAALGASFWCDSVDPKTGKAMRGAAGRSWSEVHAFSTLLKYKIKEGDICPFILHPEYGLEAYPVTFFTTASPGDCKRALKSIGNLHANAQESILLRIKNTTIPSPNPSAAPLLIGLNLDIKERQHLLITGPNGCGKTTFLRYICKSLQNKSNQKSHVTYIYLPQIPILAPGKYFWQQISYPADLKPCDEDLIKALEYSGMFEYFKSLPEGFDTIQEWDSCLSFGQKQRLCMSRVFLHKPTLAVLDESTAGMDAHLAFDILRRMQTFSTCIAVTHNPDALQNIFNVQLSIVPSSQEHLRNWAVTNIQTR